MNLFISIFFKLYIIYQVNFSVKFYRGFRNHKRLEKFEYLFLSEKREKVQGQALKNIR